MIKNKAVVDIRFILPTIESVRVYGAMPYMYCHLASRFEYTPFWRARPLGLYANMQTRRHPKTATPPEEDRATVVGNTWKIVDEDLTCNTLLYIPVNG